MHEYMCCVECIDVYICVELRDVPDKQKNATVSFFEYYTTKMGMPSTHGTIWEWQVLSKLGTWWHLIIRGC